MKGFYLLEKSPILVAVMNLKNCALTLLLCFILTKTRADIFIVTSGADSGSGSLREALTLAAANGTTNKDYIQFNLPGSSEAQRTILLESELPFLTSNLVLDGTTQPGPFLGASTAKVIIMANRSTYMSSTYETGGLNMSYASDIEIYGLVLTNFYDYHSKTNPSGQRTEGSAISMHAVSNITIGSPGKGNVFYRNGYEMHAYRIFELQTNNIGLKISANWLGMDTDGRDLPSYRRVAFWLQADNVVFGGDDSAHGNLVMGGGNSPVASNISGANAKIRFNRYGLDRDNNPGRDMHFISLNGNDALIADNTANYFSILVGAGNNIKILRNRELGSSRERSIFGQVLEFGNVSNVQVGSDDITDANLLLPSTRTILSNKNSTIQLLKNIIHCTPYAYRIFSGQGTVIRVLVNNDSEYSGTATPHADVYIYNDYTDCSSCSPLQFYQKVSADANGNWKITGDFSNKKFLANANHSSSSSEFTQPFVMPNTSGNWVIPKYPTCGQANGSLELTNPLNTLRVEWYNTANVKVGEGFKIENLPAGSYYAMVYNGKCANRSTFTESLYNLEPTIRTSSVTVRQPTCGQANGSIRNLSVSFSGGMLGAYKWVDQHNNTVSTTWELNNVGPGKYTFIASIAPGCEKSYGPVLLSYENAPTLAESSAIVQPTACGSPTGSIKGLQVNGNGTFSYTWKNEKDEVVSNNLELTGKGAGRYTLYVSDGTPCGTITSASYEISEINGITTQDQYIILNRPTCRGGNGSITGIQSTGATSYVWTNQLGETVSRNPELHNAPPGSYTLRLNNSSCTKILGPYQLTERENLIQLTGSTKILRDASCNLNNGSIEIALTGVTIAPTAYRWQNSAGQTVGTNSLKLEHIGPGEYTLFGRDANGCELLLARHAISRLAPLSTSSTAAITPDQCAQGMGSISGPSIIGGQPPYTYKWFNTSGAEIGQGLELANALWGNYRLVVTDALGCSPITLSYTVPNVTRTLSPPVAKDVGICAKGSALLSVTNPEPGANYTLYASRDSRTVMGRSAEGKFRVELGQETKYYLSKSIGACESDRTEVKVSVGITSNDIPNTISPNNDHINDTWTIQGIENYPGATVEIYSREGHRVFYSVGYRIPFDGTTNGSQLPVGIYYYIIYLSSDCSRITGNLTLIR